ncbi:MAG: hypothetical protein V2J02_01845 [Pseudomonadales bacterium]|jgi:hypothetical protein|nr:hypothetical protein [Pseudomonadales bacterium]
MFRGSTLIRPKRSWVLTTLAVAVLAFVGARSSPTIGYCVAMGALLMIIAASLTQSFWPTQRRPGFAVVFVLFWGLLLGGVIPFTIERWIEEGPPSLGELLR